MGEDRVTNSYDIKFDLLEANRGLQLSTIPFLFPRRRGVPRTKASRDPRSLKMTAMIRVVPLKSVGEISPMYKGMMQENKPRWISNQEVTYSLHLI